MNMCRNVKPWISLYYAPECSPSGCSCRFINNIIAIYCVIIIVTCAYPCPICPVYVLLLHINIKPVLNTHPCIHILFTQLFLVMECGWRIVTHLLWHSSSVLGNVYASVQSVPAATWCVCAYVHTDVAIVNWFWLYALKLVWGKWVKTSQ